MTKRKLTFDEINSIICYMLNRSPYTNDEINNIIEFIKIKKENPRLIKDYSKPIEGLYVQRIRQQLENGNVCEKNIDELKRRCRMVYIKSLVNPGEMIGSLASQCIGQPFTQMSLNTFHLAGLANQVSGGIDRLNDLLNATYNLKNPNMSFWVKSDDTNENITSLERCRLRNIFEFHILSYFKMSIEVLLNSIPKTDNLMVKLYTEIFRPLPKNYIFIKYYLDQTLMFKYHINLEDFMKKIQYKYEDIDVFYNMASKKPTVCFIVNIDCIDILSDKGKEYRTKIYCDDYKVDRYLSNIVIPKLDSEQVCGIENIKRIIFKTKKEGYIQIDTVGSNMRKILMNPLVRKNDIYTNDMHDIYNIYGICAAREFLIREYTKFATEEDVQLRHIMLLVDGSTYLGKITAVSRYGMEVNITGPLARAAFEQPFNIFQKASSIGSVDECKSISSSIIIGRCDGGGTKTSTSYISRL